MGGGGGVGGGLLLFLVLWPAGQPAGRPAGVDLVLLCVCMPQWEMVRSCGPFAFVIAPPMHACPIALCSIRLSCLTSLGAPYGKRLFNILSTRGLGAIHPPATASRV